MDEVASLPVAETVSRLRFSPDGQHLYAYDGSFLYTFETSDFSEVHRFKNPTAGHGRFHRDCNSIVLISSDHQSEKGIHHVEERQISNFAVKSTADFQLECYGLLKLLFNRAEDRLLVVDCSGDWNFVELPSGRLLWSVQARPARGSIYSPDESEIWTTGGEDHLDGYRDYLNAWDPHSARLIKRRRLQEEQFYYGLGLTPNGRFLIVVAEKSISVVEANTWELLKVVSVRESGHLCQPTLEFSADGRLMALGCDADCGIFVLDCKKWELIAAVPETELFAVRSLAFSPDGRFLACGIWDNGKGIKVWRT